MLHLLVVGLLPHIALASTADLVDLGPAMGRAGAVATRIDSGAAAYYNPGGLGFREEPQLRVGVQMLSSQLTLAGEAVDLGTPLSFVIEVASPVPLLEPLDEVLFVGLVVNSQIKDLLVVEAPGSTEPILPYYQNRTQRVVVMPAVALKLHRWLAIGVGMNYFSGLTGIANVVEGADGTIQADVEEEIFAAATGHAGIRFQSDHLSLAVAYRQRFTVAFGTASNSYLADSELNLAITSRGLYTPETVVMGIGWQESWFDAALEVSWRRWSRYAAPFARVTADAPLPSLTAEENRLVTESRFEKPVTRDVWRVALSGHAGIFGPGDFGLLDLNGGYAYEPSPFAFEGAGLGTTTANVIDGPKQIFGLGLRWQAPDLGRARLTIDVASQLHYVGNLRIDKDPSQLPDENPLLPGRQTTNAGYPTLEAGGWLMAGMASLTFELLPSVSREAP